MQVMQAMAMATMSRVYLPSSDREFPLVIIDTNYDCSHQQQKVSNKSTFLWEQGKEAFDRSTFQSPPKFMQDWPESCRILRTLPNSASTTKLSRTGTEFGRISAKLKYIMENSKCHVILLNILLYTAKNSSDN